MQFQIIASSGESVKVDGENWMAAMAKAMAFFDASLEGMAQWTVSPLDGGAVTIDDRFAGMSWTVRPVRSELKVVVAAASRRAGDDEEPPPRRRREVEEAYDPNAAPPPMLSMPTTSLGASALPPPTEPRPTSPTLSPAPADDDAFFSDESLAERLFDLSMDMAGASKNAACSMALDIILEFVPCDAGSVVRGSLNDVALTFVATHGPVAEDLIGKKLPFGQGIVGLAFDRSMTVIVNDVRDDSRHFTKFDADTGFTTRAVLTVPVRTASASYGVIQLLNPSRPFDDRDVEAVEMVALSLAEVLSAS